MVVKFNIEQVKILKEVAEQAEKRRPSYDQTFQAELYKDGEVVYEKGTPNVDFIDQEKLQPSFWFVKDHGLYLISNAITSAEKNRIVYAENFNPKDENWYQHLDALNEELKDNKIGVIL